MGLLGLLPAQYTPKALNIISRDLRFPHPGESKGKVMKPEGIPQRRYWLEEAHCRTLSEFVIKSCFAQGFVSLTLGYVVLQLWCIELNFV